MRCSVSVWKLAVLVFIFRFDTWSWGCSLGFGFWRLVYCSWSGNLMSSLHHWSTRPYLWTCHEAPWAVVRFVTFQDVRRKHCILPGKSHSKFHYRTKTDFNLGLWLRLGLGFRSSRTKSSLTCTQLLIAINRLGSGVRVNASFCCAMLCIIAAYIAMQCLFVCLSCSCK